MNEGILVVSFGTTYKETREKNIEKIMETVREAFPDRPVVQAFSSKTVRKILRERDNMIVPDVKEALWQMRNSGITRVTVLPTHIIDGIENNRMKQAVAEYGKFFEEIRVADVLLATEEDYEKTAQVLWNAVAKHAEGAPVIFMGHGSPHEADESYARLEKKLNQCASAGIYIATVEGAVGIEDIISRLRLSGKKGGKVLVTPFMLVAGDHAVNDMAGEEDSFAAKLKAAGYEPECLLKGIGEYAGIREIYLEHLRRTIRCRV